MAINTEYNTYSDYSVLFEGLNSTYGARNTNPLSDLLQKLNDYSDGAGYKSGSSKYVTNDVQTYLSDLKTESEGLKSALQSLLGKNKTGTSVFNEKSVVSSNNDVASVQTSSSYKGKFTDTEITVDQVATGQKNTGSAISSTGKSFQTGWNQFEIEVNGKKHQVSFKVEASDNNEAVQKKIAEAVNAKDIGIKATVSTDNGQKTSKLELTSAGTGTDSKNSFTVRDVTSGGGVVAKTGIDTVTQTAQDAKYRINDGDVKTSKSNNIELDGGVTVTLKKASDTAVKVGLDTDPKGAINKVREMVNGFNGLLATAEDNKKDKGGNRLYNQLKGMSSSYTASLSRIGVNVTGDGYLSIDSDKMQKAADSGELEKFFTQNGDSNYGFANRLARTADSVNQDPTSYIGRDKLYSSPTALDTESFSYLQSYRYASIINTGLLFDYLF